MSKMPRKTPENREVLQLRVRLEGEMKKRFLALKEKMGFEQNSDLVRLLITRGYEQELGHG